VSYQHQSRYRCRPCRAWQAGTAGMCLHVDATAHVCCIVHCVVVVSVQRWTACWRTAGTSGESAASGVVQASNNEFDASFSRRSTAADRVQQTPSRRRSVTERAARSLERPTDLTNSEVYVLCRTAAWVQRQAKSIAIFPAYVITVNSFQFSHVFTRWPYGTSCVF